MLQIQCLPRYLTRLTLLLVLGLPVLELARSEERHLVGTGSYRNLMKHPDYRASRLGFDDDVMAISTSEIGGNAPLL